MASPTCPSVHTSTVLFLQLRNSQSINRTGLRMSYVIYRQCKITECFMRKGLHQPYKQFFGTLANPYRLDIINLLSKKEQSVSMICNKTGHNQTTISHNLKRLERCGFVFARPNGKERIYALNHKTIKPLLNLMNQHMNAYCKKICEVQP